MISVLGHLLLLLLAGLALFRLWRSTRSTDAWLNVAIAAGFVLRGLLGAALFWISYLHLPIGSSLQKGDGLWFFAVDAFQYFPQALGAAHAGAWTIITFDRTVAAVPFVQAFATAILLFGRVASAALILNAFCYLGTMWIIVRSTAQDERARIAARIAVLAISLSPTFVLWSLQPLKDTMFQFLVVAFVGACVAWQRAWTSSAQPGRATAVAAGMAAAMFLLSGLRWYFALVVLFGATAFAILVAFRATHRKAVSFAAAAVVVFVLSRAFLYGAGPYVPPAIHDALTPGTSAHAMSGAASAMAGGVENARQGFERSGGATQIGLGGNLAKLDGKAAPAPAVEPRNPPSPCGEAGVQAKPQSSPKEPPPEVASADAPAALNPAHPQSEPQTQTDARAPQTAPAESSMPTASVTATSSNTPPLNAPGTAPVTRPTSTAATTSASVAPTSSNTPPANALGTAPATGPTSRPATTPGMTPASNPSLAAPAIHHSTAIAPEEPKTTAAKTEVADASLPRRMPHRVHHVAARKQTRKPAVSVQAPPAAIVCAPPAPVPAPPRGAAAIAPPPQPAAAIIAPASRVARLAAGTAAVLVPRGIGQRAGLFEIGGGKGFWWFSDIDTIVFDLVALLAVCLTVRWVRAASLRNPVFWLVAAVTVLIGVPLVYTVTNFGTLLRLREMIYLGLLLIPLALATPRPNQVAAPATEPELQAGSGSASPFSASNVSSRPL
jgi:hypothetical protein